MQDNIHNDIEYAFLHKVREFIREQAMLRPGDIVVCGLSGGADSVSLLLSMTRLSAELDIGVEALHVNHCLRGAESDRDEEFCRDLCSRLGVPFRAVSCDVSGYSAERSLSCEEAARKLRYGIFSDCTRSGSPDAPEKKLACAHNADDNLETVLINLTRGTGIKGLAGIPPVRGNIIRPLLGFSRREIELFLQFCGQPYVTDSTNLSDDYTRNRIRHHVIPVLRQLNSSLTETSVRSIGVVRSENRFIEQEAEAAWDSCHSDGVLSGLAQYPEVVRRRCIARLLAMNDVSLSADRLIKADDIVRNGGRLNISGDRYFIGSRGSVRIMDMPDGKPEELSVERKIGENRIYSDRVLVCELLDRKELQCDKLKKIDSVHKKLTFYVLDYDKIIGRTVVRNRRFGDRIQLAGRDFTSSVKKLINGAVPPEKRSRLHFIEDSEGTVFAECIGIADRCRPDSSTERFLRVTVLDG